MAHFLSKDTIYGNLYFVKCLFFSFKQSTFKPSINTVVVLSNWLFWEKKSKLTIGQISFIWAEIWKSTSK